MQVFYPRDFCRTFAQPAVFLVHSRINRDKVHTRQVYFLPCVVHRPVYIDGRFIVCIRLVVGIAVTKLIKDEVTSLPAFIYAILREASATERQFISFEPLREIRLAVEGILRLIAGIALVVCPADVLLLLLIRFRLLRRSVIRNLIIG